MNKTPKSLARTIAYIALILIAILVYAYGWKVTDINLEEPREAQRQAQVSRALHGLLNPDLVERDKIQALIFALERKIESIDHAIQQAQKIGYGICEKCGQKIEPERLEIFPETTLCIRCKRESERLTRGLSFNLRQSSW